MTTQLFDLITGEYIELGKGWLDGGDHILVTNNCCNSPSDNKTR